jgi:hypothetical protein
LLRLSIPDVADHIERFKPVYGHTTLLTEECTRRWYAVSPTTR